MYDFSEKCLRQLILLIGSVLYMGRKKKRERERDVKAYLLLTEHFKGNE